jgi:hypothetical protein
MGRGELTYAGELEYTKLSLDLAGLTSKGGVNVQVNQQTAHFNTAAGGSLEALLQASDKILFGDDQPLTDVLEGPVIDVEPLGPSSAQATPDASD